MLRLCEGDKFVKVSQFVYASSMNDESVFLMQAYQLSVLLHKFSYTVSFGMWILLSYWLHPSLSSHNNIIKLLSPFFFVFFSNVARLPPLLCTFSAFYLFSLAFFYSPSPFCFLFFFISISFFSPLSTSLLMLGWCMSLIDCKDINLIIHSFIFFSLE